MIDSAAFATAADLLAVVADLPAATARHAELAKLMARADVAEATLARSRQDLGQHQADARAAVAKRDCEVGEYRQTVARLNGEFERAEFSLVRDERDWAELGTPDDAPNRWWSGMQ